MRHTVPTRAVVLRTVLQKGRNVALERAKPRKGRFREEIGRREAQGGRGLRGEGKPSPLNLVNTRRWVGEYFAEKAPAGRLSYLKYKILALDRARQSCAPGQRAPYDVQITLDAQETTRFKKHPPSLRAPEKMEIRPAGE